MKLKNWMALGLGAAVLLTAAACTADDTGDAGTSVSPSQSVEEDAERTLSLLTTFVDADGAPLTGVTIRVDDGAEQLDYALDEEGSLTLAGLSPTAALELTVLSDPETEETAAVDDTADGTGETQESGQTDESGTGEAQPVQLASVKLALMDSELTDVVQEEDGSVSLSVASDAQTVSLVFTLDGGGQLQCALTTAEDTVE